MTIWFDMDGTLADLYSVPRWYHKLNTYDPSPYLEAKPLLKLNAFARSLNHLQKVKGVKIGIISWLSAGSNPNYDKAVTEAKLKWLQTHLKSVTWDEIHIIKYGHVKSSFKHSKNDILFDDNEAIRKFWGTMAFPETDITARLKWLNSVL